MSARKKGLAHKVVEFLTACPEECLTRDDIGVKFGVSPAAVHTQLVEAIASGALVREENLEDGELVYRLGKGALPKARRRRIEIDINAIEIRRGVPVPPPQGGVGAAA